MSPSHHVSRDFESDGVDLGVLDADLAGWVATRLAGGGPPSPERLRRMIDDLTHPPSRLVDEDERRYVQRLRAMPGLLSPGRT